MTMIKNSRRRDIESTKKYWKIMTDKRTYKTLDESEEAYYRGHPNEIDEYLTTAFEEYVKDGCTAALLSQ
ncbi:hypothetical protein C8R26_104179 [Nitrosomonas oligotropha]|uniref:Uncharacterized protein n=1 Tax=Nitrosomonas oligotropha TaxID=42354 RepID=A0A2T5I2Y2_9PROT|nr:hypothetical protein C8R26_104179 [Nitrosomonas oligotropha]